MNCVQCKSEVNGENRGNYGTMLYITFYPKGTIEDNRTKGTAFLVVEFSVYRTGVIAYL